MKRGSPVALLVVVLLAGLFPSQAAASSTLLDPEGRRWVEELLARMSVAEKVGQLIVAGTNTRFTNQQTPKFQQIRRNIERYHLGGYHAFGGDLYAAAFLIRRMQELAPIPLLITSDLEGGTGLMLRGGTRFPRGMALGATFDPELARRAGKMTAQEARSTGIHVTFSPVADVNSNPLNPIINVRSFGEDPHQVAKLTAAYIEGIQEGGLLATAKHFPGHGDTAMDSHTHLPVSKATRQRLDLVELPPFRAAIQAGVGGIMVAHLAIPALEHSALLPASLSPAVVTKLLREELGFQGLVFTDAMNMGALKAFGLGEACVLALEAGADLILYPSSVAKAFRALDAAVRKGRISNQRLDASVRRILEAKARLGLHRKRLEDPMEIDQKIGLPRTQEVAQTIMDRAITLVRNSPRVLPLRPTSGQRVLLLTILDERRVRESRGEALVREFRNRHQNIRHLEVLPETPASPIHLTSEAVQDVDYILVAAYVRVAAEKGSLELSPQQLALLNSLPALSKPAILVVLGNPYLLNSVEGFGSVLLAYDDHPGAEATVVKAVLGEIPFPGRLPVSLSESLPNGHGLRR